VEGVTGERHRSFVDRLLVDPAERKKAEKEKKKKAEKCRELLKLRLELDPAERKRVEKES
jgi:hypothetical protein